MNALVLKDQQQTMTSREIAELVESRHDHVKLSIDRLAKSGAIGQPSVRDGDKSANNVVERIYHVCKRDSYVIVAQLSPAFTARLVDRWQELENAAPKTITGELTRLEILEMAMASERENIALRAEVEAAAPAVEFVAKYADSTGLKGFRQVCKLLGAKENDFRIPAGQKNNVPTGWRVDASRCPSRHRSIRCQGRHIRCEWSCLQ